MGRLLIVDDEAYAIEGIKAAVDWEAAGVSEVMTAFDAGQAREILSSSDVDVVLCDIEMPQESGMDLVQWLRARQHRAEVIFLTCHTDFTFAKQAVRLRSFDYLVKPVPAGELRDVIARAMARATGAAPSAAPADAPVTGASRTLPPAPHPPSTEPDLPNMTHWSMLLKSGSIEHVRFELKAYFARLPPKARDDTLFLQRFLLDFQQVILSVLRSMGVPAHVIMDDACGADLFGRAADCASDLVRWAEYSLDLARAKGEQVERTRSHFGRAADYIVNHLAEDPTCERIAEHVGLNPDYLTRLFKKETGLPVLAYVHREKMSVARMLLMSTRLPVCDIAAGVGYANPAHFSSAFKKVYLLSPVEFRARNAPPIVVQA